MVAHFSALLPKAGIGAFGLALLVSPLPAQADSFLATYNVSLIGLPIGAARIAADFTPKTYRIEASARLSGLATIVSNSRGAANGSGAIVDGRIAPAGYATTASNATMTRTVRMSLAGNAVTGIDISPPFEDRPDRVPVTDKDRKGVVDPVGAFVFPMARGEQLVGPTACNRTIPIFDGYTRFNINLAYVGQRQVSAKGYSGPVAVCSVRYQPIAGHRPDRPATKFMVDNKDLEVWLAPVESAHVLMPFRLSVRTMIGTAVVEASEFHVAAAKDTMN
jgi:Protein of unknown function (DUF3108)